jgi:hypothetical protein
MSILKEGDFAITAHGSDEEVYVGQIVHVMREGMLGIPGGEYSLEASEENPAVLIQLFEQEESGYWEATNLYTACMMSLMIQIDPLPQELELENMDKFDGCCPEENIEKQAPCWKGYVQRGMKPGKNGKPVPNCVPVTKSLFSEFGKDYTKSKTIRYTLGE